MRSDMYKVIVERPRKYKGDGAKAKRRRNDFDGPHFLGTRVGYGYRSLNENLAPLKRFLQGQVGRPWNKVYGEICARVDRRNPVQHHIFQHLDDMIAVQVGWRHGGWVDLKAPGTWPYHSRPHLLQKLYVDPRTGLIQPNKAYTSYPAEYRAHRKAEEARVAQRRRRIGDHTLLMRLRGLWYEVQTRKLPDNQVVTLSRDGQTRRLEKPQWVFDVVLKKTVSRFAGLGREERWRLYGRWSDEYAISKRQLSSREIANYGLPRTEEPCTRMDWQHEVV